MDIGTSIAIASGILGIVAVIFKIFGNERGKHCEDHSGVCTAIDDFNAWLTKIENKLDRVIERRGEPR